MFESKDILFIVLAFCALWFTAFVCWLIWQIAMILKNVNETMADAREKIGRIEEALTSIKGRFEKATSGIGILAEGVKRVVEYAVEKKRDHKSGDVEDKVS
ncbi:hypothetical protein HY734_03525 [Candidatus Uhrbacteria bacterium]|nr:hypothetical protein [Candidatus Uhrbacteria bacterium]